MGDHLLLKYAIETGIYVFSFVISNFAVRSIVFNQFLNHRRIREAWVLYLLVIIVFTYCLGSLLIKIIGVDLWLN